MTADPLDAKRIAEGMERATRKIAEKFSFLSLEDLREIHIAETPGWTGPRDMFGCPVAVIKWTPNDKDHAPTE